MWVVEINFVGHRFTHEVHGSPPVGQPLEPAHHRLAVVAASPHARGLTSATVGGSI